jgi:hypothetical protein
VADICNHAAMNPRRLLFSVVAGCCFSGFPLLADDSTPPFSFGTQYSADETITTKDGTVTTMKIYADDGKVRSETTAGGMQMVSIIRPDQEKMYTVMVAQKMVMQMPLTASHVSNDGATINGSRFQDVGTDTVDGVACTKYKVTTKDNQVFYYWVDPARKVPVKMMAEDGSMTAQWKDYQAGPQDASLFEPPSDFKVMALPGAAPGGGQ